MSNKKRVKHPNLVFLITVLVIIALYILMKFLQPILMGNAYIFGYAEWFSKKDSNVLYFISWILGDITEPLFYKSVIGGLFFVVVCIVVYVLEAKKSHCNLTAMCYGDHAIWPWIFASGFLSLCLSNVLFGTAYETGGTTWIATFVPFLSAPSAIMILYRPGWKKLITATILGTIFTTPICLFISNVILPVCGFPGVVGIVASMCLGSIICFEICPALPWMHEKTEIKKTQAEYETTSEKEELSTQEYMDKYPGRFFIRRLFVAFSEPMYIGNEFVGIAIILGTLFSWFLNPQHTCYGGGILPELIMSELLTGAIAIYFYWDKWKERGYYPTFAPVVSVGPTMAVMYGANIAIIIIGVVLGAIITPAIADRFTSKLPSHWHPVVGNTGAMTVAIVAVVILVKFLTLAFPILL